MSASLLTQHRTVSADTHPQSHNVSAFSCSFRIRGPCHIYAAADIDDDFACVSSINGICLSLKAELVFFYLQQTKLGQRLIHTYSYTSLYPRKQDDNFLIRY
jgi:hypothetical protein